MTARETAAFCDANAGAPATPEVLARFVEVERDFPGLGEAWARFAQDSGGALPRAATLAEAVVRELREETGVEGVCGSLIGWVERIGNDHHFVILDFAVDILEATEPVAGDDAAERHHGLLETASGFRKARQVDR